MRKFAAQYTTAILHYAAVPFLQAELQHKCWICIAYMVSHLVQLQGRFVAVAAVVWQADQGQPFSPSILLCLQAHPVFNACEGPCAGTRERTP